MPTSIWQVDFYRRPLADEQGQPLWELVICDPTQTFTFAAFCPQVQVDSAWLATQLEIASRPQGWPDEIHLFRPQAVTLLEAACRDLSPVVKPTRQTATLKRLLQQRAKWYPQLETYTRENYDPTHLEQAPPQPLPEHLWGDRWQFAAIAAAEFETYFAQEPIPILDLPHDRLPLQMGLPSTAKIPGVVVEGGRQSMPLAQWLQAADPVALNAISTPTAQPSPMPSELRGIKDADSPMDAATPGGAGLVLEAGLCDRWILFTYSDMEVITAGDLYEQRKQACRGLHFLLITPDDSGMTSTGLWLLHAL